MSRAFLYPLAVGLLVVGGCASIETHVVTRAARDFTCERERTVITDQFGGIYRVEGCGFMATYECRETNALRISCAPVEGTETVAIHAAGRD